MGNNNANTKKTVLNVLKVSASNVLKMLAGVLVGFLLPKVIGLTDYGYYKVFTLYATYVGLFHFGFSDGIFLKYGGKNYDDLERPSFRLFTTFLISLEFVLSALAGVVALLFLKGESRFIFSCLAVYLLSANITGYYQIISQITSRFNELSLRTILQSVLTCVSIAALWLFYKIEGSLISYRVYTVVFISINLVLTIWYIITYREITFGKKQAFSEGKKELRSFFFMGFPLLFSNLCSTFILAIDRQFVSILFNLDTYAVYAFAYNMLALITTALTAISTVLYPTLKRTDKETLKNNYPLLISVILIVVFLCLLVYFPLKRFIPWFLPKYTDSLPIFRVILPGLAISSAVTIVMHNYYKTDGKELSFFLKSIIILVLSGIANFVAYLVFGSTISISIASTIVMLVWYILIEEYFIRTYKIEWVKNFVYMLIMAAVFYLITAWDNWWVTMLLYAAAFLIVTVVFYRKEIRTAKNKMFGGNNDVNFASDSQDMGGKI